MLSLIGLGVTTIRCRGRAVDQTSGSVAQCSVAQCSPIPGNKMILYFSVQLVEKLAEPPQSKKWEGLSPSLPPPISLPLLTLLP